MMTDDHLDYLTCEQFDAQLASYLEDELPEGARAGVEAHAASCARCGELFADVGALRQAAAELPAMAPSRDLWAGIAERIDAPVLPIEAPRSTRIAAAHPRWLRPSIAAAALVLFTAGITHLLTRASYAPGTNAPAAAPQIATARGATAGSRPAEPSAPDAQFSSTATEQPIASQPAARRAAGPVSPAGAAGARLVSAEPLMKETQPVYDREMGKLREILVQRRGQLDPKTVAVLEQSIAVMDSAIAQSRAALARDPASGFLAMQLNHSLEKKVELLRTAATLPART